MVADSRVVHVSLELCLQVRYESRKKLAEQRPRVKGQFVRQGQTSNLSPMEVDTELATTETIA